MIDEVQAALAAAGQLTGGKFQEDKARKTLAELQARQSESLGLYTPLPYQERFHSDHVQQILVKKGNRTGAAQPVDEPVLTPQGWMPIGQLKIGDSVIGGDGKPCPVTGIFPQGMKAVFRVTFDDGASTRCCEDHLWKCKLKKTERFASHPNFKDDKWGVYSLYEIRRHGGDEPAPRERAAIPVAACEMAAQPCPLDPYMVGVLLGDGCISHGGVGFTSMDEQIVQEVAAVCGEGIEVRDHGLEKDSRASRYSVVQSQPKGWQGTSPVCDGLRELELMGKRGHSKFVPDVFLLNSIDVRLSMLQGLMDTDGYVDRRGIIEFSTTSPQLAQDVITLVRSLGGKGKIKWREHFQTKRHKTRGRPRYQHVQREPGQVRCLNTARVLFTLRGYCPFRLSRKAERWAIAARNNARHRFLTKIEPHGNAECVCIQVDSPDHTYVTRDYIVTHNTLSLMVEIARAVTGQDPYNKYPKKDGKAVILVYGENHVGRVAFNGLFKAGSFKWFRTIEDLETGDVRTFRPWSAKDGGDIERYAHSKPHGPLIPKRFIDGKISWLKRSERVFSLIRFTTGWELYAANSAGDPGQFQGLGIDLYAIDEDLASGGWYEEAIGRIADTKGKIRWTALPHAKNDDMMRLVEQAENEKHLENPNVKVIQASILDNKFISDEYKEGSLASWKAMGEDVYRKRVHGELDMLSTLMYPTFSKHVHDVMKCHDVEEDQKILLKKNGVVPEDWTASRILAARMGEPPADWCRFASVDPGYSTCAVSFLTVPPPELGNQVFVYDELYIQQATSWHFGEAMSEKATGVVFEKFIMDFHGGKLRGSSHGEVPIECYQDALTERGVKSETTGHSFWPGCDDVKYREEVMRTMLAVQRNGQPRLMVVAGKCPAFVQEMLKFRRKTVKQRTKDIPTNDGDRRAGVHMVEATEQAIALDLEYARPKDRSMTNDWIEKALTFGDRMRDREERGRRILGGDSISLGAIGARR